ncbi:hypothetical protein RHMOL_Rhmol06G0274900 [Rhododendron molle]|uniref:Uncharacterized protein n=1 Tax=Rhododendron molle TaxID=49168 RepID=A0ACC0NH58_RHOML|nr:hypothetical protein RHMOL_Rhmol06G0274900 [Rhododendron molle]
MPQSPSSTTNISEARLQPDRSPTVVEVEVNDEEEEREREREREREDRCWKKVVDLEEAKNQFLYLLPVIITNVSYHLIPVVAVMFAGHLGDLELAGSILALSWATVTGFAFMVGLSGALETLCGQGYGAKLYRLMGIYLQASFIISLFFSILISILWFYSEPILILLHQDHQVSKSAALYLKFLIPGLFAYGFFQNIMRFLQAQSVVVPLVFCSVLPLIAHFGVVYTLVHRTPLGFKGAALAASISLWISVVILAGYVLLAEKFRKTWNGVNTEAIAYMVIYGLSMAASTRVSNELGAGNPDKAKHAMVVTLMLSLVLTLIVVLALAFGHTIWAGFFSDSITTIKKYASMSHFVIISIILESITGVLSGVARGCGWQNFAVFINLGTLYCIGMPISIILGFKHKLYTKVGLSGALEALCGQGYGAKLYRLMGIYLQASCVISIFFSILISILWFFSEPILILLHQHHQVSKSAALYLKFLIPGVFAYGFLQNIEVSSGTECCRATSVLLCASIDCSHWRHLYVGSPDTSGLQAFKGATLAASISLWIAVFILAGYVLLVKKFRKTCNGLPVVSSNHVFAVLKLALPSAVMVWQVKDFMESLFTFLESYA